MRRAAATTAGVVIGLAFALAGLVWSVNVRDEGAEASPADAAVATQVPVDQIARGAYLARAGDCVACHTTRGGVPFSGGRAIETPFGSVYAPNLTPDPRTGLGGWSARDFWRALHNGRSRDGRLLYPAFPYPNYTRVVRADADAIFAYLQSLPPVEQASPPNELVFPFGLQASLAVWRALYFRPRPYRPATDRSAAWNRGAYLVEGLGHCNACHSTRNAFGATPGPLDLAGGLIPVQNWYAPSLTDPGEAGVAHWEDRDVMALLKTGLSSQASVMGPMSEVVLQSTQYLSESDLAAITVFLKALPQHEEAPRGDRRRRAGDASASSERGARLYTDHCAACHGADGAGVAAAYPPLAGSRAVTMRSSANLVHIVLEGGFPPATAGNPRPFGMPPFANLFGNDEVADLLTYIRSAWGNDAPPVLAFEVNRFRSTSLP